MIDVKIKSLWKGMIPLRDKYVNKALRGKQNIRIISKEGQYILNEEQLKNPRTYIEVPDKFSPKIQKLYYFSIPTTIKENYQQMKLL